MPAVAGATCVPVGPKACADGFEKDATGWGCRAIVAEATCDAPMRAKLGSRECVPVDDCTAPFPPPGATLVTQGGAVTLATALNAAPRGATIAIDTGSYDLSFVATRDVKVVGRCASKVTLRAIKQSVFTVGEGATLDLRSVSLAAPGDYGVYAILDGHATLTKVIITGSQFGVGSSRASTVRVVSSLIVGGGKYPAGEHAAGASIHGAELTFEDSDIHGFSSAVGVYHAKSKLSLVRSVVAYEGQATVANLAFAGVGGTLEVKESLLRAPRTGVLDVNDAAVVGGGETPADKGATATVVASELSQVGAAAPSDYFVLVHDAGRASFEGTTFIHASDAAIRVLGATSSAAVTSSVFRVADVAGMDHAAVHIFKGAAVEISDTALIAPVQYGVVTLGLGSRLSFVRSLISGTARRPTSGDGKSVGVALALSVVEGAEATVSASTILASEQYGIHTGLGGTVTANDVLVDATAKPETGEGSAAIIVDATARIAALRCVIRGSADAAFVFRGGGSVVGESTLVGNAVVLRLAGASLSQLAAAPAGDSADVVFYANRVRGNKTFSSSELPEAIVPPPFQTTP